MTKKVIYIGADHCGFALKELIKEYLNKNNYDVKDLGNRQLDPDDDYPDYAAKVAQKVVETQGRGILICRSGVGMCIAANKVHGIRAVNAQSADIARNSREDDDTNILCLASEYIDFTAAKEIIDIWLETEFSGKERHRRRLKKIENLEGSKK